MYGQRLLAHNRRNCSLDYCNSLSLSLSLVPLHDNPTFCAIYDAIKLTLCAMHSQTSEIVPSHNSERSLKTTPAFGRNYWHHYYYYFDPGTHFPGNEKITLCNTKKYKNQANLTPPPPSQNSHAVTWHCTAESKRRVAEIKSWFLITEIIIEIITVSK